MGFAGMSGSLGGISNSSCRWRQHPNPRPEAGSCGAPAVCFVRGAPVCCWENSGGARCNQVCKACGDFFFLHNSIKGNLKQPWGRTSPVRAAPARRGLRRNGGAAAWRRAGSGEGALRGGGAGTRPGRAEVRPRVGPERRPLPPGRARAAVRGRGLRRGWA